VYQLSGAKLVLLEPEKQPEFNAAKRQTIPAFREKVFVCLTKKVQFSA